jgi:hypothetical protein
MNPIALKVLVLTTEQGFKNRTALENQWDRLIKN